MTVTVTTHMALGSTIRVVVTVTMPPLQTVGVHVLVMHMLHPGIVLYVHIPS